jgi:hypothetical protein
MPSIIVLPGRHEKTTGSCPFRRVAWFGGSLAATPNPEPPPAKHEDQAASAGHADPNALKPTAEAALKIIQAQKGRGLPGKSIVAELAKKRITITLTTFRKHIVPQLKGAGVKNERARGGYYSPK